MKNLSLFINPYVVSNLYAILSLVDQEDILKKCINLFWIFIVETILNIL